jgi:predicted transcriptional regulator
MRRTKLEMKVAILYQLSQQSRSITQVIYKANLNMVTAKELLCCLEKCGLVKCEPLKNRFIFHITQKGFIAMRGYATMLQTFGEPSSRVFDK